MGPNSQPIKCEEIETKYKDKLHLAFVGDKDGVDSLQYKNVFEKVSADLIN